MSLNPAGAAFLARALWTGGSRTPPFVRPSNVNRLSTTRSASGESHEKAESCGSSSDRPGDDAPSSGEPPHKCKKRLKEPPGAHGVSGVRRRSYTSKAAPADLKSYLWARYNDTKRLVHGKRRVPPAFASVSRTVRALAAGGGGDVCVL